MPLVKVVRPASGLCYGIRKITEDVEVLLQEPAFTNHEGVDVPVLHPEKQLEYVSSRLLIADLCEEMGIPYTGLKKDEYGKPHLLQGSPAVSLSHSYPFVVAILSLNGPVGIDLEYPGERLSRLSSKFVNEEERSGVKNLSDLCKIWCVKETLYKIYGRRKVDFKKNLLVDLGVSHDRCTGWIRMPDMERRYELRIEEYEGFIYTYNLD